MDSSIAPLVFILICPRGIERKSDSFFCFEFLNLNIDAGAFYKYSSSSKQQRYVYFKTAVYYRHTLVPGK